MRKKVWLHTGIYSILIQTHSLHLTFNATLSGQTYAIAYASKTLDIETEVMSKYRYWLDHAGEAIVEIHANGYGDVLEKCLYKN